MPLPRPRYRNARLTDARRDRIAPACAANLPLVHWAVRRAVPASHRLYQDIFSACLTKLMWTLARGAAVKPLQMATAARGEYARLSRQKRYGVELVDFDRMAHPAA
jgi:hypothetical protein